MGFKLSINAKMLVFILTTTLLIFILSIGYLSFKTRQLAINDAQQLAAKTAQENALRIEKELANDLAVLRTLSQALSVYDNLEEQEWKELYLKMYYKVFAQNKSFYKLWDSWEIKQFDPSWPTDYGRYAVTVFRQGNQITNSVSIRSEDGDNELYTKIKTVSKDMIWEPYWDAFVESGEEKKFMTSLSSPIYKNKKFAGIVAADIIMDRFQDILTQISKHQSTLAFLTSNEGVFVGHPDQEAIGQTFGSYYPEFEDQFHLSKNIKEGTPILFKGYDKNNKKILIVTHPIQVGEYETPWALTLIVPYKAILADANKAQLYSLIAAILGILILSLIIISITRKMSSALVHTTQVLQKLSIGDIESINDIEIKRGDEIEDMANSLNALKNGLNKTSEFAAHIGKGDLDSTFTPLSEKDVLGKSLLEMRNSLRHADEEEKKRKIEDEKLNWATQGLAKFGEILRTNTTNIKELSFNIMKNLVTYLDINQGALFIINETPEGEPFLEMKSAIAYGRDKFVNKQIGIGEELVGRCAFEKKSIYMTDLPKNYIKITSGLGTANPSALLLVPLVLNEEIFGVIELASFHEIPDHQIEFVERLGESIASTIATVKVNEKTSMLLGQSKSQAEELAAQEEEMRQNLEELQATQEESSRRDFEMTGIIKALGTSALIVEYDLEGTILSCNEKYSEMLGISIEDIIGHKHYEGFDYTNEKKASYDLFWGDLTRGISKKEINKVKFNNKEFWVEEIYTPIIGQNENVPYKILKIGFDITSQKAKELTMQEQEIRIKKEHLLLGEYQGRMVDLQEKLKLAESKITELESQKTSVKEPVKLTAEPKSAKTKWLEWTDDLALDIDEMDEQHKQVIALINQLQDSVSQGKNKKEIKENLRSFIDFASYHFGNEEQYFDQFGFNDSESHGVEHQKFLKEVKQLQSDYSGGKENIPIETLASLKNRLLTHFEESDIKYKDLFKLKGL
jgi:methyl-accepting chemotaxis protein